MPDSGRPAWLDAVITTTYGAKDASTGAIHNALDFALPSGTPVTAGTPGKVERTFSDAIGGRQVIVNSGGFRVVYAHLNDVLVKAGDSVSRSTVIGRSGSSGTVTGPHLHVGVTDPTGGAVNPQTFFEAISASLGGGGKPGTASLEAPTSGGCGLTVGQINKSGDLLKGGQSPEQVASYWTGLLGRPITVDCMRADAYKIAKNIGEELDLIINAPVVGGAGQGVYAGGEAVKKKLDEITSASGFLSFITESDNIWRAGFVLLGAVLIFTGARLYLRPDAASEQPMKGATSG